MGLVSTLLTGGVLVGKICQSLSTSISATHKETGLRLTLSDLSIGDVKFIQATDETKNGVVTYVANTGTAYDQSVAIPNINSDGGGVSILVPSLHKVDISDFLADSVSPDTEYIIGAAEDASFSLTNDPENMLRLTCNNTKIGDKVTIGGFATEIGESCLKIVSLTGVAIYGLHVLKVICTNGVRAMDTAVRAANADTAGANDDNSYIIEVSFSDYGLKEGDVLSELTLSLCVEKSDNLLMGDRCSALSPVEMELIEQLKTKYNEQRK